MKDETGDVAIEEFVGLKPNMYSFLADNSERWKTRDVDKNVIATASHNEYKDVLLNNKCIRDPINRIQSKDHIIGTNEINRISQFYFNDKVYIQSNEYDGLPRGYPS